MKILVTGAAGFIGSHTLVVLLEAGHEVIAVDNFSNSNPKALDRVREITGKDFCQHAIDIRDRAELRRVFASQRIEAAIHFAGLKAVGESVLRPIQYYDNNLCSTIVLVETMAENGCLNLVVSSSATVYGDAKQLPLTEGAPLSSTNPYGRSKLFIEEILRDVARADSRWKIALLRYFNPVGAHPSGKIGEAPNYPPNNLFPYVSQVAIGRLARLSVYGNDYPTKDGTGVRDYIHVMDLAEGHLKAVTNIQVLNGAEPINLGTGVGYSVMEVIDAFEKTTGRQIAYKFAARRPGDIAACYADPDKARHLLGWNPSRNLLDMCRDGWRWQERNPNGYSDNT